MRAIVPDDWTLDALRAQVAPLPTPEPDEMEPPC